jgi:predicted nucleotidyltransferase
MTRTPTTLEGLREHRHEIVDCAASRGARNVRVFGSMARGGMSSGSDIDFLVEMESGRSLLDLVGLRQDLSDLLGGSVDVLSDRGLSAHLRDQILSEAIPL